MCYLATVATRVCYVAVRAVGYPSDSLVSCYHITVLSATVTRLPLLYYVWCTVASVPWCHCLCRALTKELWKPFSVFAAAVFMTEMNDDWLTKWCNAAAQQHRFFVGDAEAQSSALIVAAAVVVTCKFRNIFRKMSFLKVHLIPQVFFPQKQFRKLHVFEIPHSAFRVPHSA